jgi:hypothetical protein
MPFPGGAFFVRPHNGRMILARREVFDMCCFLEHDVPADWLWR